MIKSFKEFLNDDAEIFAIYHYDAGDREAEATIARLLGEAKKQVDLGKGRMIYHHKAHGGQGQDHLHFNVKGKELYSVNKKGTAHDRSHGKTMARWALDGAEAHYPDFIMPKDGLIEELIRGSDTPLLLERFGSATPILVSMERQKAAVEAIRKSG